MEERIVSILKKNKFNFTTILPGGKIKKLYDLILVDNFFTVIEVAREESGFGVCAGAYFGGSKPFMLIQSTGLINSLNSVFSLIKTYEIPLLVLASYRGYFDEKIEAQVELGKRMLDILVASDLDHYLIRNNIDHLNEACHKVLNEGKIVICLLSPELFES